MSDTAVETRERVEVEAGQPAITLPGALLHELCAHALEAQPEECCGLILGTSGAGFVRAIRCGNEMTARHQADPERYPRDGRSAYYMSEIDYLQAQQLADANGEQISAIYHSHVGAGAYMSEMDQEYATHPFFPFPDAAQIVLAVWERKVASGGVFSRNADTGRFEGVPLDLRKPG